LRVASNFALSSRPDAVICIDSPEFTHRVATRVRRGNKQIPIINYVAPQVWAWRPHRAAKMARTFDLVLALLPFESALFETHGLRAPFVGHPVVERAARIRGGAELRERLGIPAAAPVLAVLPGSRISEIQPLLPVFRETVARVKQEVPDLVCLLPAVPHLAETIRALTNGWPVALRLLEGEAEKFAAFDAADAALAASGTVTTELALADVPMVVAYKGGWLSSRIARALIRVPHLTLVNILLGREAVPEFLQVRCRAELIAPCVVRLLKDADYRARQQRDLREAVRLLGAEGESPSLRAARVVLQFIEERRIGGRQRPL
ncbi:MAG TPA: lipid-A-disaccharide synthase, partial [Rhizomicrobium sp.]|nr:lipid-A-disaccharide synthase [Rhizomicrobium sp.]